MGRDVLVLCAGRPPWPGWLADRAGRRAWGLGQGLTAHGHRVAYAVPEDDLAKFGAPADVSARPLERAFTTGSIEVVVSVGWRALAAAGRPDAADVAAVLDLPWPELEANDALPAAERRRRAETKLAALRLGDYYVCAAPRQQLYFKSWLILAGLPQAAELLLVPFAAEDGSALPEGDLAPVAGAPDWPAAVAPLAALVARARRVPALPAPSPAAPDEPVKSWSQLLRETRYHYRRGGLPAVAATFAGFARKLLSRVARRVARRPAPDTVRRTVP
jgi:hypothetical protein